MNITQRTLEAFHLLLWRRLGIKFRLHAPIVVHWHNRMTDLFESPKRLIAWANKNILDLKEKVDLFFKENSYEIFSEPDSKKSGWLVFKARLKKPLPDYLPETVADILDNLRSALDQTLYAIAALGWRCPRRKRLLPIQS